MLVKKSFILLVSALLAPWPTWAQQCEPGVLREQFENRWETLKPIKVRPVPKFVPQMVEFQFSPAIFLATNYECDKASRSNFPGMTAYGWLIEIPEDVEGDVVVVRKKIGDKVLASEGTLGIIGETIYDYQNDQEYRLESTIDFLLEHQDLMGVEGDYQLIVSGPYWRRDDFGEMPKGIVVTRENGLVRDYEDFGAHHVLCFLQSGIELIDWGIVAQKIDVGISDEGFSRQRLNEEMQRQTVSHCQAAVQVGPTYWEPQLGGSEAEPGISGLSNREGRRSVVFQVSNSERERTFIFSTVSSVGTFDAMVVVAGLSQSIDPSAEIAWAVSLQDEDYISGPIVMSGETVYRLNQTDVPAGALLTLK